MKTYEIICGIIMIVAACFLIFAVLMQSGKSKKLSGTIAGGAETFFGKTKGKAWDKMLSRLTTGVSIAFVLIVLVLYIIQPDMNKVNDDKIFEDGLGDVEYTETID